MRAFNHRVILESFQRGSPNAGASFRFDRDYDHWSTALSRRGLKLAPAARWLAPVKLMDVATREHLGLLNEIKTDTDSGKGAARPGR
jgi:hypothetical protein